jgi:hypothetical protein
MPNTEPETANSPTSLASPTPDPTAASTDSSEDLVIRPIDPPERFQTLANIFVASEENIERARTSSNPIVQIPTNQRIYADSVVYAVGQQDFKGQNWIQLKVCSGAITPQTNELEPQSEVIGPVPPESEQVANPETGNSETAVIEPGAIQKPAKSDSTLEAQTSTFLAPGETGWINSNRYQELLTDATSLQRLDPNDPAEGIVIPECAISQGLSQEEDIAEPQDATPEASGISPSESLPPQ